MRVLALGAFHRDATAAVTIDGRLVAVSREEHFTRVAHDSAFPARAARSALADAGLESAELDAVVFYEKPLRHFERVLAGNLRGFPRSAKSFSSNLFTWLGDRLWIKQRIAGEFELPHDKVLFADQLMASAAFAHATSPFEESAVLVVDDAAERSTTLLARAGKNGLERVLEVRHPHSLGLVNSAVTQFLGLTPGEDEPLVECLAASGTPRFDDLLAVFVPSHEDLYRVDSGVFRFEHDAKQLWTQTFEEAVGAPRFAGEPLRRSGSDRRDADLAASLEALLTGRVLELARTLHERTGETRLCLGGSLALHRGVVRRLIDEGPFEAVHVAPCAGKSGATIGAALLAGPELRGGSVPHSALAGSSLLPHPEDGATPILDPVSHVAEALLEGQLVGWADGRTTVADHDAESRVALVHAGVEGARERLLGALQRSESFEACRLLVRVDAAERWVRADRRQLDAALDARVFVDASPELTEVAPSAALEDGRVWLHAVDPERHPRADALLRRIEAEGRAGLVLCTPLALRGAPTPRTEADAVQAFERSALDLLVTEERAYGQTPVLAAKR